MSYEVPYRLICRGCGHTSTGVCSTDRILPEPNGWTCPGCDCQLVVTLADVDGGGIIKITYERLAGTRGKARVTIRGTPAS